MSVSNATILSSPLPPPPTGTGQVAELAQLFLFPTSLCQQEDMTTHLPHSSSHHILTMAGRPPNDLFPSHLLHLLGNRMSRTATPPFFLIFRSVPNKQPRFLLPPMVIPLHLSQVTFCSFSELCCRVLGGFKMSV